MFPARIEYFIGLIIEAPVSKDDEVMYNLFANSLLENNRITMIFSFIRQYSLAGLRVNLRPADRREGRR